MQGKPDTSDDIDFYKFNVTSPVMVTFAMPKEEDDDWVVNIYDDNGIELGYAYIGNGTDSTEINFGLEVGTYYIKITDYDSVYWVDEEFFEEYSFTIAIETGGQFEKEYNDKHNNSTLIDFNTSYTGVIQGRAARDDIDLDFYKFTLTQDDVISFEMKQQEDSDWDYVIYDENLNALESGTVDTGLTTYKQDFSLSAGAYYLEISDATDMYNFHPVDTYEKYTFKVTQ